MTSTSYTAADWDLPDLKPPAGWEPEPREPMLRLVKTVPRSEHLAPQNSLFYGGKPTVDPIERPFSNQAGDGFRLLRGLFYNRLHANEWPFLAACNPEVRSAVLQMKATGDSRGHAVLAREADRRIAGRVVAGKAFTSDRFITGLNVINGPVKPEYHIAGIYGRVALVVVFGPSGVGKTFHVIAMIVASLTGTPWAGREVKKGLVVLLAGEGRHGLPSRLIAGIRHIGADESILERLLISVQAEPLTQQLAESIALEIKAWAEQMGEPVVMVIIDTLTRHIDGVDSDPASMSKFVRGCDIISQILQCVVVAVTHTGLADTTRVRGSSILKAATDTEIRVDKGLIECTKQKDGEPFLPIRFALESVVVGTDPETGEDITSAVPHYTEALPKWAVRAKLSKQDEKVLAALDTDGMTEDQWRDAYKAERPEATSDAVRKCFTRALEGLTNCGLITVQDGVYTKTGQCPDKSGQTP